MFVEPFDCFVAEVLPAEQLPQLLFDGIEFSIDNGIDGANRRFIFALPSFANRTCQMQPPRSAIAEGLPVDGNGFRGGKKGFQLGL